MPESGLSPTRQLVARTAILTALAAGAFCVLALLVSRYGGGVVDAIESSNATLRSSELVASGRSREAAVELYRLLAIQPDNDAARAALVEVELLRGRTTEALELAEALGAGAEDGPFQSVLGEALLANGRFDEAAAAFESALALRPGVPNTLYGLAMTLGAKGRLEESRARFAELGAADMSTATAAYRSTFSDGERAHLAMSELDADEKAPVEDALRAIEWLLKHGRIDDALAIYRAAPEMTELTGGDMELTVLATFGGAPE